MTIPSERGQRNQVQLRKQVCEDAPDRIRTCFVALDGGSAGVRGARFQAVSDGSSPLGSAGICGGSWPICCPSHRERQSSRGPGRESPLFMRLPVWTPL